MSEGCDFNLSWSKNPVNAIYTTKVSPPTIADELFHGHARWSTYMKYELSPGTAVGVHLCKLDVSLTSVLFVLILCVSHATVTRVGMMMMARTS